MTIAELLKVVEAGMKMARKILAILPEHQKDPLTESGTGPKPSVEFTPGVAEGVAKLNIYRDNHPPPGKPDFTTLIRPRGKTQPVSVTGLGDVRGGVVMGLAGLTCVTDLPPVEKHESVSVDVNGSVMVVGVSVSESAGKAHRQRLTLVRDLLSGIATEIRILGLQRALLQPEQAKAKKKKKAKKRPDPLQVATDVGLYGPPKGSKQYQNSSDAFKAQYQREQSVPRQSKGRNKPRAASAVPEVDPVQASRRLALSSALILRDGLALALSTALDLSSWPFPGEAPPTPAKPASLADVAKVAADEGEGADGSDGVGGGGGRGGGDRAVDATQDLYMSMHGQTTRDSSEAKYAYFGGEEEAEAAAYARSTPATSESEPVIMLSPAPAPAQRYRVVLGTSEKADKAVEGREDEGGEGEGDAPESFLDRTKRKKSDRATSTKFGSQSKYGRPVADDGETPRGRGPWNTEAGIGAGIAAGSGGTVPKRTPLATSSSAPTIPSILHLLPTPVLTAQQAEKDAAEVMRRVKASGGATGLRGPKKARPKSARARPSGPAGERARPKARRPQSARGRSKSPVLANASGFSPSRSGHPSGNGGDSVMAMFAAGLGDLADTKTRAKTRPGSVSPTSRPAFKSAVPTGKRVESPAKQSWRQREEEEEEREHDKDARRKALQLLSLQKKGADDEQRRSKLEADIASKARRINRMNDQVAEERASAGRSTFGHGDRFKTDAEAQDAARVARERYLLEERDAAEEARRRKTREG